MMLLLIVLIAWRAEASDSDRTDVSAGSTGLSDATAGPDPSAPSSEPATNDLDGVPVPAGMVRVAGPSGATVGFAAEEEYSIETVDERGGFGSFLVVDGVETRFRGVEVVDGDLRLVGYVITPIGFVAKDELTDVASIEARVEEREAENAKLIGEHPELTTPRDLAAG